MLSFFLKFLCGGFLFLRVLKTLFIMKIYTRKPDSIIRISIYKQGCNREYLTVCDTTLQKTVDYCKQLIQKQNLSVFFTGRKTAITVREAIDGKNGKSINLSFTGLTPKETRDLIINDLNKKNG